MSTWKQFFRGFAVIGGYLALLAILIVLQGVLDMTGLVSYRASLIPFMVLHLVLLVAFFIIAWRLINPPVYQQAQIDGQPATAQVLAVEKTGWRSKNSGNNVWNLLAGRPLRPRKWEYKVQLRVTPPHTTPYETTLFIFVESAQVPVVGTTVAVKIHPQRPDIVVLPTYDEYQQSASS